jgi:hypothetical protein
MSERAREPLFIEDAEEAEREPSTESAGSGGSLTAVGSGVWDSGGDYEPPIEFGMAAGDDPRRKGTTVQGRLGAAISLMSRVYSLPIADLNLSMRASNVLRRGGFVTVGQVLTKTEEELLSLRNFRRRDYLVLREKLDELGILPNDGSVN